MRELQVCEMTVSCDNVVAQTPAEATQQGSSLKKRGKMGFENAMHRIHFLDLSPGFRLLVWSWIFFFFFFETFLNTYLFSFLSTSLIFHCLYIQTRAQHTAY